MGGRPGTPFERVMRRTDVDPWGCWLFLGSRDRHGYGRIKVPTRVAFAHRIAYEHLHGPIPTGLVIDHLCRVHNCVNPDHMEPVTAAENTRRSAPAECQRGHPMTTENRYVRPDGDGGTCRACQRLREVGRPSGWERARAREMSGR